MVMQKPGQRLGLMEVPEPRAGPGQMLVRVAACAVCRTDLHVLDGELPEFPVSRSLARTHALFGGQPNPP